MKIKKIKKKKIICNACKKPINFTGASDKMLIETKVNIDGNEIYTTYFKCNHCGEIYIVLLLDDTVREYQRLVRESFNELNSHCIYAEHLYNSYEEYEQKYNAMLSKYELAKKKLDNAVKELMSKQKDRVILYLQNEQK